MKQVTIEVKGREIREGDFVWSHGIETQVMSVGKPRIKYITVYDCHGFNEDRMVEGTYPVKRLVPDELDEAKQAVKIAGHHLEYTGKDVVRQVRGIARELREAAERLEACLDAAAAEFAYLAGNDEKEGAREAAANEAVRRLRSDDGGLDAVIGGGVAREGLRALDELDRWREAWAMVQRAETAVRVYTPMDAVVLLPGEAA
jgi:hypothetical protein